jgi:cytochrome c553
MSGWPARLATGTALLALAASAPQSVGQAKAPKKGSAAAASSAAPSSGAAAGGYAQRFATLCAACHGANGRGDMPLTPVLAGQPAFYSITQLFLFREGRRSNEGNEGMTAVAKGMSDDDMRGFADFIGTLPPVPAPPPATPPDAPRIDKARSLAQQHKCVFCHGADYSGGQQVPRLAGQREDYLQMSLRGFRSGERPGYTQAMSAAVSHVPLEDLDTLAYYIARFPGAAAAAAPK